MSLRDKRILVTGAGGFLGTATLAALAAAGVKNIATHSSNDGDLRDSAAAERVVGSVDIVIHLAGITGGIAFHRDHADTIYADNLAMGMNVLMAAQKCGAEKFVMAGSLTEYGQDAPLPLKEDSLWSGEPKPAHAAYARAKREILQEATKLRASGLQSAHLLFASMYGPGERSDFVIPALIKKFLAATKEGTSRIIERGTGATTRDFLYVRDAADAIVMAAERYDSAEPLNIASGKEISIFDLAHTIGRLVGYQGEVVFDGAAESTERFVADISRAQHMGWDPRTSLEEGLATTIEWHRKSA